MSAAGGVTHAHTARRRQSCWKLRVQADCRHAIWTRLMAQSAQKTLSPNDRQQILRQADRMLRLWQHATTLLAAASAPTADHPSIAAASRLLAFQAARPPAPAHHAAASSSDTSCASDTDEPVHRHRPPP